MRRLPARTGGQRRVFQAGLGVFPAFRFALSEPAFVTGPRESGSRSFPSVALQRTDG